MINRQPELSSFHQVLVIVRLTIREARRRRMLWLGLGLGLVFVILFGTGYYFAFQDFNSSRTMTGAGGFQETLFSNIFLTSALYVVNFLIVMVTALTTVGSVSAELDSNSIHAIAAKPIRRWEIILGKWLGNALLVTGYTCLMTVGVALAVLIINGYFPPNALAVLLVLILESLVVLSLTMFGSTVMSTLANGVLVFMMYGLAFVGGWVEQIGSLLESPTAVNIGIASSLLLPSEGLWRYAAAMMQETRIMNMMPSPLSVISQPSFAFVIYALLYAVGLLLAAMWAFGKRDL